MSTGLVVVQILNGLQFGVLLFLIAAGLTLVFGVMDFINLAHGVQYMLGAYLAVAFYALTSNFFIALLLALAAALVFGLLLEFLVFRHLYDRDHLEQVIATFGIIIFLNPGPSGAARCPFPRSSGSIVLMPGLLYPVWRLVVRDWRSVCSFTFWWVIPASACWFGGGLPMPEWCPLLVSIFTGFS